MALKIYWTKRAYHKFDDIILYLTTNWGEKTISIFVKKVYDFFDILTVFPDIGTIENESKNIRGFVIVKQITLFYKVSGNKIIILNFF